MATEQDLHDLLLSLHRRTGEATGYWPHRFLAELRRKGALAVAKRLLKPRQVSSGFERLITARRADLTMEWIATTPAFSHLFTSEELGEARRRLRQLPDSAFPTPLPERVVPGDEIEAGSAFEEGTLTQVLVNAYERNATARSKCIQHFGAQCVICNLDFGRVYGEIGEGFINVHHTRPLATLKAGYRVNPVKDLVPVCPNCHAMLHRRQPPLDVEQLRMLMREQ
jgi:5-methylcytosine-specific restriction protein A